MPALSITSFDRLIIEPAPSPSPPSSATGPASESNSSFTFYPPLYTTPVYQRPPSPSTSSPSPYVLNFKRRWNTQQKGRVPSSASDSSQKPAIPPPLRSPVPRADADSEVFEMEDDRKENIDVNIAGDRSNANSEAYEDSCSRLMPSSPASSVTGTEDLEFYDAKDSVFSDSASDDESSVCTKYSSSRNRTLSSLSARLQEEISRRIKAEHLVAELERRLKNMEMLCSDVGISIEEKEPDLNEARELLVARLVASAISRATVRAAKDEEIETMVAAKNREISRLWDKLQYLELINREMSQRNQEVTEITQRQRRRRQQRQKWFMSILCASVCLGSVGLACYKFLPWDNMSNQADLPAGDKVND